MSLCHAFPQVSLSGGCCGEVTVGRLHHDTFLYHWQISSPIPCLKYTSATIYLWNIINNVNPLFPSLTSLTVQVFCLKVKNYILRLLRQNTISHLAGKFDRFTCTTDGRLTDMHICNKQIMELPWINPKKTSTMQMAGNLRQQHIILLYMCGGTVVNVPLDQAVRVRALAGNIVLCSWGRHFTLTVPLSAQVNTLKWVHGKLNTTMDQL